jgi:two-component system sensor histidine kinase UhpB
MTCQGFGLAGMKERIQGLMGEMKIESTISQGAKITVKLRKQVEFESAVLK